VIYMYLTISGKTYGVSISKTKLNSTSRIYWWRCISSFL